MPGRSGGNWSTTCETSGSGAGVAVSGAKQRNKTHLSTAPKDTAVADLVTVGWHRATCRGP